MEIFEEKQFINRWWLLMFIFAIILIVVGSAYYATMDTEEDTAVIASIVSLAIAIPLVLGLLYVRLESRIDENGITAYFKPFSFTKKFFPWSEIKKCYVREYNPVTEFGGWGIRGLGMSKKAYNIYGNKGIQIITSDDKEFLIGTQRPEAAEESISTHFQTTTNEI